jgi:uncharacterized protein YjiS (DUF1127 family)
MGLALQRSTTKYEATETLISKKGTDMSMIETLRSRLAKRAAYVRTRREIANLPAEFAIEDLGIVPSDANKIASRAVYG